MQNTTGMPADEYKNCLKTIERSSKGGKDVMDFYPWDGFTLKY